MSVTILLVEDEAAIREMLRYALEKQSYQVVEAADSKEARQKLMTQRPDLIVVDWMMPGESGVDFIRRLKRDEVLAEIPCMMLTARVEESDKVHGLEAGADDYMVKPVAIREFQARIKALLRRVKHSSNPQLLSSNGIELDLAIHQLTIEGQKVSIGASEFNLLKFFLSHKNKVYSRSQLLDYVWGQGVFLEERTVDVHMLRLRKILKPFAKDKQLTTVRGMGYMFSEDK